ncbi:hypothetical protein Tco_0289343 [Tanacetum coccineum]
MDRNNVRPIPVSINTKFLNCLQPEWSKYVTMIRHNQTGDTVSYDQLYDSLVQFEPHIQASKAKRASRNHDPLALIAHSNASLSQSHASPSYSNSPQPYYVTHPSSVVDYEEDYQGELQEDSQEDKLTIASSSNHPEDGRVDIHTKNAGYGGNGNRNAGRQNRNQAFNARNGLTHNDESHYACDCQKTRVRDAKYFREQMLLAMKDKAGSNLKDEENDFMLDNSYGDETLEELTAAVIMMARIQPSDNNAYHGKHKTVVNTSDDDQIDSNIIFANPYVENNGGSVEHDSNAHDQYHDVKIIAYNVQRETKNKKRLNNELKKQKDLLQKKLETSKKAFKEQENRYLEDIVDLEEKLSSYDRFVYKMGQSIQSIYMLGKTPNKVYDPFLKDGLGYQNPEPLKKAIAAQPKMYHGEMLQKPSAEQTYFSIPSASNVCSKSNEAMSDLQIPKIPKESKLLKMFDKIDLTIMELRDRIDDTLLEDRKRRWMSDSQNSLREFYKTGVISMSESLPKFLKEIQQELIEQVHEMLNIFESMEKKVEETSPKDNIFQNEIDRPLEVSLTREI